MFAYDDRPSFLRDVNPVIKLALILFLTVLVSLSFYPALAAISIMIIILQLAVLGRFHLKEILHQAKFFIVICLSFMLFLLLVRGLKTTGAYSFGFLHWEYYDFVYALSLGLRIMVLALLSLSFVLTTNPNDLVLSMMLQLKVSHVHGYAALAAYRFLPTFTHEVAKIQLAQAIRGVEDGTGIIKRIKRPFKLFLPLMSTAIRRGERVAMAMESRALGAFPNRTFYRRTTIRKKDILFLVFSVLLFTLLTWVLIQLGLFHFNLGFSG